MKLVRRIGVALAATFAVLALAPTAALAGKPVPAPSAPPRLVVPPTVSTEAVYRVEVRVLHCFDESEPFSDEIEIWRETDGGYFNVRNINDVDGGESHGVWVQFTFSSYTFIDLWERDSGSYEYLGYGYIDGAQADGSIRYAPVVGGDYEYLIEYSVWVESL